MAIKLTIIAFLLLNVFVVDSFVLLSAANSGGLKLDPYPLGVGNGFSFDTTVLLNEAGAKGKDVGYRITGDLDIGTVWGEESQKLIKIELKHPKLYIKSRKAPSPEGFVEHTSRLESMRNEPFYVHWNVDLSSVAHIKQLYIDSKESLALLNLKRGIASLLQFQHIDGHYKELDVSGNCNAIYVTNSDNVILKQKENCTSSDLPYQKRMDPLLSVETLSNRISKYTFGEDGDISEIVAEETHEVEVTAKKDAGNNVKTKIILKHDTRSVSVSTINAPTLEAAVASLAGYKEESILTKREPKQCQDDQCPTLTKVVKELRGNLDKSLIGTSRSANAFLRVLPVMRTADEAEISKVLESKDNYDIITQLCDLAGFAQTVNTHKAMTSFLRFDSEYDLDNIERYLWALSMGTQPKEEVILDILKRAELPNSIVKITDTLTQTVAAMANSFASLPENNFNHPVVDKVTKYLSGGLKKCKDEECKIRFLRAFGNLRNPKTIQSLIKNVLEGKKAQSVAAMQAIRSFPSKNWNQDVIKACIKIFFQIPKKFDSSARTLALDIILESEPTRETVKHVLEFLKSKDTAYEVKQYVLQKITMISESNLKFRELVKSILKDHSHINNYAVFGQRGLTTAFSRDFLRSPWSNGSIITTQELSSGILKRGVVDIVLEGNSGRSTMCSFSLFAAGLSGFVGGDDELAEKDPEEEEEVATAGLQMAVQGISIRPFVFFQGQGELMGHAWSGTASTKTTAYAAIFLLHDHQEYIRLQTGSIADMSVSGAASYDLSGQVQLSLWNRNAHSLVEKSAGIAINGALKVDTEFVRSQAEFSLTAEPKLNLESDIDFYNKISLCMQLVQPSIVFKHNIFKIERIPGSKHRLRKATYRIHRVAGQTHALNQKNNEMCNAIFAQS